MSEVVAIVPDRLFALSGALAVAGDRVAVLRGRVVDGLISGGRDFYPLCVTLTRIEALLRTNSEDAARRASEARHSQELALVQAQVLEEIRADFARNHFTPEAAFEGLSFDGQLSYYLLAQLAAAHWAVPEGWAGWSTPQRLAYFEDNAADIRCELARSPWVCDHEDGLLQTLGTMLLVAGTVVDGLTIAEQLARPGVVPLGFANRAEFESFGTRLLQGLEEAGYPDAEAAFQGSSVTGRSFRTGVPFDVGRVSDYDIALSGPSLFSRVEELGVALRRSPARTGPLGRGRLGDLGLGGLRDDLTALASRKVDFMIYRDMGEAIARSASVRLP